MLFNKTIFKNSIAVSILAAMLFACEGNLKDVKVKANLRSPEMLDFSNRKFPFREFPNGVEVDFFESDSSKNTIISDYAIIYNETNLVDLRGNVKIITSDSTIMTGSQLYWDQENEWVFTDYKYQLKL